MSTEVTSRQNPLYKEVKGLIGGLSPDLIIVEGKKLLVEALRSDCEVQKIFIDKKNQNALDEIIQNEAVLEIIFMDNDLISSLYSTNSSPTQDFLVLTLANKKQASVDQIVKSGKDLCGLVDIQDPGNLGTIIRSALGFNFGGIFLVGSCTSPFNTKVIRASAGAVLQMPCVKVRHKKMFTALKQEGYKIIAASQKSEMCIRDLDLKAKNMFLFGNEGHGLPEDILREANAVVKIPHEGNIESLNLAACANILFWEAYNKE